MAKRKTVQIPNYRGLLSTTGVAYESDDNARRCLDALGVYYGLTAPFGGFLGRETSTAEKSRRWMLLAICLASEVVPAFRIPAKGGPPKRAQKKLSAAYPHADEARLVQMVAAIRTLLLNLEQTAARTDAFRELIRLLKKKPAYDWYYGELTKVSSFVQAWKKIPRDVRAAPENYLPPIVSDGDAEKAKGSGGLFGLTNYLIATEPQLVWIRLPPIPEGLAR